MLALVLSLFHLQPSGFTYIIENVPGICRFPEVEAALGPPVIDDAIWYGSASHRRTCFWSNAAHPAELARRMRKGRAGSRLTLRDFLVALPFFRHLRPHHNSPEFFPKFMRRVGSHAHRLQADGRPGPGMLIQPDGHAMELPPKGRELAMGFYRDSTAAPLLLPLQRHQALGNCIDLNLATAFIGAALDIPQAAGDIPLANRALCTLAAGASPELRVAAPHTAADRQRLRALVQRPCVVCGLPDGEDNLVFCDGCDQLYHLRC